MHKTLMLVWALALVACAGPDDMVGVADEDDVAAVDEELLAPCCGGFVYHYEWQCHIFFGWRKVQVGSQEFSCVQPYVRPLQGRTGTCSESARYNCNPLSSCDCGGGGCGPAPTTPCGIVAPPPLPPVWN